MNLAVNASDAMPAGGRLTIRIDGSDPDWAELTVEDSGHGIPETLRELIFEPFFTTKEIGHGTGLGLSVVHGIVAEHGGRIAVESRLGTGTVFRIHLPRIGEAPGKSSESADGRDQDLLSGRGERVLVVEDEEAARQGLAELLSMMGYRVAVAGSAEEAAALAPERPWDLLLTDLLLPGATGITLAGMLTELWPSLKVVVMSGYAEDESIRRAIGERSIRFLQKPFDMNALAHELRAALDGTAAPPLDDRTG
jgi:CheY-like chemotaxis protein